LKVPMEIIFLPLSSFSGTLTASLPTACSFSVPWLLLFFLPGRGSVSPRGCAALSQRWLWEYCVMLICSPVGLLDVFQAVLLLVSGGAGVLLFAQCNMAWRSFVWAGGLGCWTFDSSWCYFSDKCGSTVSARFLIYIAHAVYFCMLVAILDPPGADFWSLLQTEALRICDDIVK
jgi:hypothetical protein